MSEARRWAMGLSEATWAVLWDYAPLFGLSFSIFALKSFRLSLPSMRGAGLAFRLLDIVLSSLVGASLIVSCCILAAVFRDDLNHPMIVALAVFLSVGGVALVDGFLFKYFGVHMLPPQGRGRGGEEGKDE